MLKFIQLQSFIIDYANVTYETNKYPLSIVELKRIGNCYLQTLHHKLFKFRKITYVQQRERIYKNKSVKDDIGKRVA